ncbi:MAG: hypothetical protein ACF8R7_00195 [Phycisphaerales bacterium JB039]
MRPRAFGELWRLAIELAPRQGNPACAFDRPGVGLILRESEGRAGYDCTPLNADAFAETGGDGVHFSLLRLAGVDVERFPVVMTVPMAGQPNHIVGESLTDFLAIGCRCGYFCLEQLAYDRAGAIAMLEDGREGVPADEQRLLRAITDRLGLRPWPRVASRLDDLDRAYRDAIDLGESQ